MIRGSRIFFFEKIKIYGRPICSLYHLKQEPKKEKFYDNTITFRRGLRIGFWPILDGVPRFGPPQDPNITIKKLKHVRRIGQKKQIFSFILHFVNNNILNLIVLNSVKTKFLRLIRFIRPTSEILH